jgi:MFS family permease
MAWQWLRSWVAPRAGRQHGWSHSSPPMQGPYNIDDPIAQFKSEVTNASEVLRFLVEEGPPYRIPDELIDKVEKAQDLAASGTLPTAEDRAELVKAYRDLIAIPGSSVIEYPPTPFRRSPWWCPFLIISVILPLLFLIVVAYVGRWHQYWACGVGFGFVSGFSIWGLYVFTGMVTNRKLNEIIAFCYIFTGLIVVGSILPWATPSLFSGEDTIKAPISILRGCAEKNPDVPKGVKCDGADGYQWVVNIGGVIPRVKPGEKKDPPELGYKIQGGLIVPLYVIVLAIIGGAVSMTRRVPEYQRRAMTIQDPLTNQQAREFLIFEIMQVLTAFLIAIVAYYIVAPDKTSTAVVLAFGSGFASAPILLMIRALVDKLAPARARSSTTAVVKPEEAGSPSSP